ncbi:MAG: site-specific integrase [Acidobacteria bacterium]|nr:site-specific integrase [Acidobacteriota bacterium]
MNIKKDKKGRFKIDFRCRGRRIIRVIGSSKREAEAVAAAIKTDIMRDPYSFGRKKAETMFEDHAREFLQLYSKENKRSWRRDENSLDHLAAFFKGKFLSEIKPEAIEKYRVQRKAAGVSPATINLELACLKTCLSKAVEWEKLDRNPAKAIKKYRLNNGRMRILTAEESRRLIAAASPALRPVLVVALNSGMRRGEILSLRWKDVDFVKGTLLIEDSKSGKSRRVPMNAPTFEALRGIARRPDAEFVFENLETRTHVLDVKTAFHGACRRAGITGVRFHDLRHTALTRMIESGADLVTVSQIAGHSTIQMTMRYVHPSEGTQRAAVEKLAEFFRETGNKAETVVLPRPVIDYKSRL